MFLVVSSTCCGQKTRKLDNITYDPGTRSSFNPSVRSTAMAKRAHVTFEGAPYKCPILLPQGFNFFKGNRTASSNPTHI